MFIMSEKNWKIIESENIIGTDSRRIFNQILSSDKILVYVNGISEIKALYNVVRKYKDKTPIFDKKIFPYRFEVNQIEFFNECIDFKNIVPKLKFIKNKEKWYTHIGGLKGATQISLRDYTAMIKALV